jgi:hypothetical protein
MSEHNAAWPAFLDRDQTAQYISERYFRITKRSVERLPLQVYRPGRRALHARDEIDLVARGLIESSLVSSAA